MCLDRCDVIPHHPTALSLRSTVDQRVKPCSTLGTECALDPDQYTSIASSPYAHRTIPDSIRFPLYPPPEVVSIRIKVDWYLVSRHGQLRICTYYVRHTNFSYEVKKTHPEKQQKQWKGSHTLFLCVCELERPELVCASAGSIRTHSGKSTLFNFVGGATNVFALTHFVMWSRLMHIQCGSAGRSPNRFESGFNCSGDRS